MTVSRQLIGVLGQHSSLLDFALAGVLAAVVIFNAATGARGQPGAGTAVLVLGAVAIGWRRRWPGAVVAVTIGAYLADHLLTRRTGPGQPAVLISLYTLAAQSDRKLALAAMLAAAGAVLACQSAHGSHRAAGVLVSVLALLASTSIGLLVAERRREKERERRLLADNAAAEERVRIAWELHDVVAHHLSVIVVQANVVAESLPPGDTGGVSAQAIVDSGRRALAEMRRILDVLRAHEGEDALGRAPSRGSLNWARWSRRSAALAYRWRWRSRAASARCPRLLICPRIASCRRR